MEEKLLLKCFNFELGENNCYQWQGSPNTSGYGQIKYGGKSLLVHRTLMEFKLRKKLPRNLYACPYEGAI